jgi:solute carrier family 25 (mitochondrial folate transporter), member 32
MDFLIGFISSTVASAVTYPTDVIKSQYQVGKINHGKDFRAHELTLNIYRQQGVRGFYRGIGSHLATYPAFWSIFWELNKHPVRLFENKMMNTGISAFTHATLATLVANPLFFLKLRKQTEILKNNHNVGYGRLISDTYKNEGMRAFYKGYPATAIGNIKLGIQFPLYDYIKDSSDSVLLSSVGSKVISSAVFYPVDLIRGVQRDSTNKLSMTTVLKKIWKTDRMIGFYKGIGLYNLCTAPNFIIMMIARDKLKTWID